MTGGTEKAFRVPLGLVTTLVTLEVRVVFCALFHVLMHCRVTDSVSFPVAAELMDRSKCIPPLSRLLSCTMVSKPTLDT